MSDTSKAAAAEEEVRNAMANAHRYVREHGVDVERPLQIAVGTVFIVLLGSLPAVWEGGVLGPMGRLRLEVIFGLGGFGGTFFITLLPSIIRLLLVSTYDSAHRHWAVFGGALMWAAAVGLSVYLLFATGIAFIDGLQQSTAQELAKIKNGAGG